MVDLASKKSNISIPQWHWPLWTASAVLLLTVAGFIGLKVYLSLIQKNIASINEQIKNETAKINTEDAETIVRLGESLGVFSDLIGRHSDFASSLNTIGALTYQKVVFTKFDANRDKGTIQLKGIAQNYAALAKQIVALREDKNFTDLEIKGINFGFNGLDFEISASVISSFFTKNKNKTEQ